MKVILLAAISADGKIAKREGQTSLDWTSKEDMRFFVEKTKEIGVVVMGRKTFDTIGKPLSGRRIIVMSSQNHPLLTACNGSVEYKNGSARELLKRLEEEGYPAVVIAGGASIYRLFLKEKLVDELFLTIEPVLFGQGVPFISEIEQIDLELKEVKRLGEQAVLLWYKVK